MQAWKWYFLFTVTMAVILVGLSACKHDAITPSPEQTIAETTEPSESPDIEFTVLEQSSQPLKRNKQTGINLPTVDPLKVEGDLYVAGSFAVFPIIAATSTRFVEEGYAGIVDLSSIGSGKGFEIFCQEGTSDIATASRPIRPEEIKACGEIGRKPIEFSIGIDALAIVTHPENDFLNNATLEDLARIFTAEKWSDINENWPDEAIQRFIPNSESGAFDVFTEKVFDGNIEPLLSVPNIEFSSEDEDFLVQSISTNPYSIGFFSFAYYRNNKDLLKLISVNGLRPSIKEDYPLIRPLLLYTDAQIMREKAQVASFLNFFFTNINDQVIQIGYFLPPQEVLDQEKIELLNAQGYEEFLNADADNADNSDGAD